ncbi:hypothetical protein CRG98_026386 [Punica granatum]|uniref:NB-ARC domain-containing protein n=1 Tax=Punica granatum TaxID=22663 RepID=A0A2I0JAH4_PUNGR|nr:hypothetical protein CRG98_026386 [Punica granatum]
MDDQVKAVLGLLDVEAYDVRYVGIHGMGGIGKTTLAKVVFNELSPHFDGCSFLSDIRESWKQDGVKYLQKQLLSDLQGKVLQEISDHDDGIWALKANMRNKKILLVLDDVEKTDQIDKLAGNSSWFGTGSRIIITTRDIRVLATDEVKAFKMEELDSTQALRLFSRHAFWNDFPPSDYFDLSEEAISVTGHLPLCLEIIGSFLRSRCKEEWADKIKALKKIPPKNIADGNKLWMHDVLRELGREIVQKENFKDPGRRSRLWMHEEALGTLEGEEGTEVVQAMRMSNDEQLTGHCFGKEAFKEIDRSVGKLKRLKHLNVKGCDSLRGLPEELGSLDDLEEIFVGGKRKSFTLPEIIGNLKSLIILEIFNVQITNGLPSSLCRLNNLKRLALIGCSGIERLPDSLGDLESLIELDISYSAISELPDSIGNLRELKVMVMTQSKISTLPGTIGMLKKLEVLHAGGTLLMGALPREMESLSRLKVLDLSNTRILELFSVSKLSLLQTLDLEKCHQLRELPELPKSLVSLHVSSRSLQKLPDLSELHNLVDLKLYDANDDWALGLVLAKVGAYRLNESFSFDALMNADGECSDNIEWVQKMSNLVTLELSLRNFTNLPTDFRALTRLKALELSCPHMSSPPQLPFTLSRLILGHLVVKQNLPDLSHLKNLSYLRFYNCLIVDGFFRIGIKELHSLNALMIDCCEIYDLCGCCLPENLRSISIYWCHSLRLFIMLSSLKKLKHLHLWECSNLCMLQGLGEVESLQLEDLSKLQKLEVLEVEDCDSLVDVKGEGGIKATQDLIDERQFAETPGELRVIGGHSQHSLQISTQSLDSLRDLSLTDIYKFWT